MTKDCHGPQQKGQERGSPDPLGARSAPEHGADV